MKLKDNNIDKTNLYRITRTSTFYINGNPDCDITFEAIVIKTERCVSIFNKSYWYDNGYNHRFDENKQIYVREIEEIVWLAYVPDILEFVKKYGSCIIELDSLIETIPNIQIYDDYR